MFDNLGVYLDSGAFLEKHSSVVLYVNSFSLVISGFSILTLYPYFHYNYFKSCFFTLPFLCLLVKGKHIFCKNEQKVSPNWMLLLITRHIFSDKYISQLVLFWWQRDKDQQTNTCKAKPQQGRLSTCYVSIPLENTTTKVKGFFSEKPHIYSDEKTLANSPKQPQPHGRKMQLFTQPAPKQARG